ncbi:MAG: N4-gp56 family major capsid protein [Clostridiales bacterium]|jgi:N4-gp56 family major capsid protein|nr:N4-gp56 family major capsid protein [Clostridiales bacterium]
MNLQLFAAGDLVNSTQSDALGNNLSAEMKTFYDKTLITLSSPYLIHDQFGQKRDIPKGGGREIEFRRFSSLPKALTPLVEGITPTGNKLNVSSVNAVVDQYGDYIEQTDLLELTAVDNTIVEATKQLAAQAGLTMDTIVRNEIAGGTNVQYCPKFNGSTETAVTLRSGIDATCLLKVKDVFKAAAELKAMNAPKIDGYYVGVIHPYVAYDLMQEAGNQWLDVQKYTTPENMLTGEIGSLGGVRFVESTEAKIFKGADLINGLDRLTMAAALSSAGKTITVNETVTEIEAGALSGRKILIEGITYTVKSAAAGTGGTATVTVSDGDANIPTANTGVGKIVYAGEGGAANCAVFATLIVGADAYGVTSVNGGGIEHIVKQKGYGNDPLNQRSSIGWKSLKVAKRLVEEYLLRIESGSTFSSTAKAN